SLRIFHPATISVCCGLESRERCRWWGCEVARSNKTSKSHQVLSMLVLMRHLYSLLILLSLLCFGLVLTAHAQVSACDGDASCIGNALTSDATSGKGAQYVDVDTASALRTLTTAMTFEAWIKPQAQPGTREYVAGLWGPNQDNNDQWVIYI